MCQPLIFAIAIMTAVLISTNAARIIHTYVHSVTVFEPRSVSLIDDITVGHEVEIIILGHVCPDCEVTVVEQCYRFRKFVDKFTGNKYSLFLLLRYTGRGIHHGMR